MNNNRYRIIFNTVRDLMMVVAEHVTPKSGSSASQSRASHSRTDSTLLDLNPLKLAVWLCTGSAVILPLTAHAAGIVADSAAPANQRPGIAAAANGVPLVNIQTPSSAGVSRNTYSQFDVSRQGAILNNSRVNAQTQLGGWVQGNPNLAGGTARVILNEVNSSNPSLLNGFVEIAGSRAQLVIANPAGISCDGCGFINANRATLTTGTPIMNSGNLVGYRVGGGSISFLGNGLDASQTNYTDVIARAVHVNSGMWANQLNVITGANQISIDNNGNATNVAPITPDAVGSTPNYAVDVSELGGMYAGKIRLIGTEAGLGVRNAGEIGASVGEVSIEVDGTLSNLTTGRIISHRDSKLQANQDIDNEGIIYAGGNAFINSQGNLTNTNTIAAQGSVTLESNDPNSSVSSGVNSLLAAGLNADGTLGDAGNLAITASQSISALGQNLAGQDQTFNAQSLDLVGSQTAGRNLTFTANNGNLDITDASISASGALAASTSQTLDNTRGNVTALGAVVLQGGQIINDAGLIEAAGNITLDTQGQALINTNSGTTGGIVSQSTITLNTGDLDNQGGFIGSKGDLTANSAAINNSHAGIITSESSIALAGTELDNRGGQIQASGDLTVNVGSGTVINSGNNSTASLLRAGHTLAMTAGSITNAHTQAVVLGLDQGMEGQSVSIATDDLNNTSGAVRADVALILAGHGSFNNTQGLISSGNTLNLSDSNLAAKALAITNTSGTVIANADLQIDSLSLTGDGKVLSQGDLTVDLTSDYTQISAGELQANGDLSLTTTGKVTNQSSMVAGNTLTLDAVNITNTAQGEIVGLDTHIYAAETLTNRGLVDGSDTFMTATTLNNIGTGNIFGDHVAIAANTLANQSETIDGVTSAAVIAARNQLDIGAQTITNQNNSLLFSSGNMAIGGGLDVNHQATVAIGEAQVGTLTNRNATLEALGDLSINANNLQNLNGGITTQSVNAGVTSYHKFTPRGTSVVLNAADYPGAQIGNFNVEWRWAGPYRFREYYRYVYTGRTTSTQVRTSLPGQILAGGNMTLNGNITNADSKIIAGGSLNVTGATLKNQNTQGQSRTTYSGTVYYYDYDGDESCGDPGDGCYDISASSYNPSASVSTFNLPTTQVASLTAPVGTGTQIAALATDTVNQSADDVGPADVQVNAFTTTILDTTDGAVGTVSPNVAFPTNSLFQANSNPSARYLVETNPRFANYQTWLSSDYMLQQLSFDPATIQKRIGDGFYEQRLVREQVTQLTGRRFLTGYVSDEAQYQALMASAVTQANALQLIPGVALTEAQIAQLTSDIVWLVEQQVTLPDGTVTTALVPQVYVRLQDGDLHPTTGIMSGNRVSIALTGDVTNQGTIAGRDLVTLTAQNINNLGGQIVGEVTQFTAANDINNIGGQVVAADALLLDAGNDINLRSTTQSSRNTVGASSFSRTNIDRVAGLYVNNPDAILVASAGNDINLMAARIVNQGQNGTTQISAGQNINLGTVTIAEQNSSIRNAKNYLKHGGSQEIGSAIEASGDVALAAGNDLNAKAASVTSGAGAISVIAANDINITEGRELNNFDSARKVKKSGTFSSTTKTQLDVFKSNNSLGSNFSADSVVLQAGKDINVIGSNVVSDSGTELTAGSNINVAAAKNTAYEFHERKTKKSGLSTSGASIAIGTQKLDTNNTSNSITHSGSTVGSVAGDVSISAGKAYTQKASDVLTPAGDIDISAQKVDITAAQNVTTQTSETKFKQSGLSFSIQSSAFNLAQNVMQTAQDAFESEGTRNKTLNALKTYANGASLMEQGGAVINAVKEGNIQQAATSAGIKLSVSAGSSKSESSSSSDIATQQGSQVRAGGNTSIKATQGDLYVQGSQVLADQDVILSAAGKINLSASADTESNRSGNKSSSASVGLSMGVGEGAGFSFDVAASRGKGRANSDSVTYNNTQVSAGEVLILNSVHDTNLIGANASGKQVVADVGRNLNIQSLQDIAYSQAKQSNTGIGVSVPVASPTLGNTFVGISQSKQYSNSNYASVYQQSGIKAGEKGFNIEVAGNTDLKGAVIDSSADATKNRLITSTLTTSDIYNYMGAEASTSGMTISSDMLMSKYAAVKDLGSNLLNQGETDIRDNSVTRSAIVPAEINITDNANQEKLTGRTAEETIVALSRDTTNTHRTLTQPDIQGLQEKAQQEQAEGILLSTTITAFSDESFMKMFVAEARIYKKVIGDIGNTQWIELDDQEKQDMKPNDEGKVHVFNNGIFNSLEAAQSLASQNNDADYLVYFPEANNFFSELLIAGYQKYLEGNVLGLANATQTNVQIMNQYGQTGLQIDGHSRGGMTTGNALESVLSQQNSEGSLANTDIRFFGSAYNVQDAADLLNFLSYGNGNVHSQVHVNDFVGTIIGGNHPTGGTTPENSNMFKEWLRILYGEATAHNGYGEGKNEGASEVYWQDSPNEKAVDSLITPQ